MTGVEENIVKQAVRFGDKIPDKIANAPQLRKDLNLYFQAFMDLNSDRNNGHSIGAICWTSIKEYVTFYEFDDDQIEKAFFLIREMDNVYLKEVNRRSNSK